MPSYYEKHKAKILEKSKAYYESHKEEYAKYREDYKVKNAQKLKDFDKKRNKTLERKYQLCKNGAKARKISFALTFEQYHTLVTGHYFYCGQEASNDVYLGIDRINSDLQYTQSNCRPSCAKCNYAKLKMSEQEFKKLVIDIFNFWASK